MSLLLEALQRADNERKNQGDVPGIDTAHSVASNPAPRASQELRKWLMIALMAITLLLLAYVVYLQTTRTQSSSPDKPVASENNEPEELIQPNLMPQESSPITVPSAPMPAIDRTTPHTTQAEVAALYERLQSQNTARKPAQEIPAVSSTNIGLSNETRDEQIAATDQENTVEEVYSSIPFASQLPEHQQSNIPSMRYTTHGYARETGKGMVTLNGRTQRRGDTISPGLVLLDIRADYIVLDMNGVLFRLPAATDWN